MQTDADLQALLTSTYHRDGGAGHALTYWRGRQALAKEVLASRHALRALIEAGELLLQLAGAGATPALRMRLESCRQAARACLPEGEGSAPEPGAP